MLFFVDVILPIPVSNNFTYQVSQKEFNFLKLGMRVGVQFGKSKIYAALVVSKHNNAPQVYEAKEIEHILDDKPIVTEKQLKLWKWIAEYYMCAPGEVMRAALPSAFLLESETLVLKNDKFIGDEKELNDNEFLIYEALQYQSLLKIDEIVKITGKKTVLPLINGLIEKGVVLIKEEMYEQYKPKLVKFVRLQSKYEDETILRNLLDQLSTAPKQREIILNLFSLTAKTNKPIKLKELLQKASTTVTVVKSLVKKEVLDIYELRQDRISYEEEDQKSIKKLSASQNQAFEAIKKEFTTKSVCLLHGVTSSGKTEVYVKLIKEELAKGKQVLYLLPEIALTTQLITRLQNFFGTSLSVYHSKFTVHERIEVWHNVKNNSEKAKVIIGARSSIFLPFADLGLIIVDEEHETSFKQHDPAPRYHARDTAIVIGQIFKAKIVLGSATPSIETYYNALQQKYGLVILDRRYGDVLMPEMNLVDLKVKYKKKQMTGHFSDTLINAIEHTLNDGFQVILFQNRRGYSPVVECNTCGHSPQCPNCDVSLTFHNFKNQLRCHYCGYHMAMLLQCLACGSSELSTKGFGTEQIEKELQEVFPERVIARMDQDTTRGKHGYQKIITRFEQEEIDVLVGTQMLSKGLDFRKVQLVGIMNADNLLNFPDFRAYERSFQLIQQVAGRAGRTKQRGKVLIQTYNPYHQILQQVTVNDYSNMYRDQIEERKQYKYPPFYRLIKITARHKDYNRVNTSMQWLGTSLTTIFKENVLGPEFPPIARIRNQYHKHVLIKIPSGQSLQKTKSVLQKVLITFQSIKEFSGVRLIINVDVY
ncbi:primosomal protein N' [Aquimarina sp. W85]|uniref:replication restart helicase PriA n=1 Tax=Aquimarina rhodophyticola TaxID=3342246 RepID=UPI00366EDA20